MKIGTHTVILYVRDFYIPKTKAFCKKWKFKLQTQHIFGYVLCTQ